MVGKVKTNIFFSSVFVSCGVEDTFIVNIFVGILLQFHIQEFTFYGKAR
jgi:hypothetical protein